MLARPELVRRGAFGGNVVATGNATGACAAAAECAGSVTSVARMSLAWSVLARRGALGGKVDATGKATGGAAAKGGSVAGTLPPGVGVD